MVRAIFLCVILLLTTSVGINAKNPASSLIIKGIGDEAVVFVKPSKMSRVKDSGTPADMEFDVTFSGSNDSIGIRSTHLSDALIQMDRITIDTDEFVRKYPLEKIFVEPDGRRWKSRLCFYVSLPEFIEIATAAMPPKLIFGIGPSLVYRDNAKSWKSRKRIYKLMLEIIELNNE